MNRTIATLSLIFFAYDSYAMESVQKSWRSSIRERILLLKKNSNTNLFANNPEAIDYAPVAKENRFAYSTPLQIELNYGYYESIYTDVRIINTGVAK